MANNRLNVNLAFTADTGQAKRQLQDLKKTLDELGSAKSLENFSGQFTQEIGDAIIKASELKRVLDNATNVNTGRLDLGRFSEQLNKNNIDLKEYATSLVQLGPEGERAFNTLARSIAAAETPLKRTNVLVDKFAKTFGNAVRWQVSSRAIRAFGSAINDSFQYAEDLNKSLNSIQIVTGKSADELARVAKNANDAAKALSTTTLGYTDAALTFYQQGLDDNEVQKRVETTLKMSNVTGESTDQVATYMTAIWNNFADGSQSLESFADKITALGAATASSSSEIANGLQQFAAIGNTIGLSYDYATAALATVVAQTRKSASAVGNSFRTIFSRLQGLSQGETLEDGTDLNKYSKALAVVDVQIKDANGELRNTDNILSDLGAKWKTLAKDQQVALAQTVGGVRNYADLISLMDNWDIFQKNLNIAQNAEGSLEEQQERYAQSWEAARKRVQASAEGIYDEIIDDDFFIKLNNMLADSLNAINKFIDKIGGLKGVLLAIGAVAATVFQKQIAEGAANAAYNISVNTGLAKERSDKIREDMLEAYNSVYDFTKTGSGQQDSDRVRSEAYREEISSVLKIREYEGQISDERMEQLKSYIQLRKQLQEYKAELLDTKETIAANIEEDTISLFGNMYSKGIDARSYEHAWSQALKNSQTENGGLNYNNFAKSLQALKVLSMDDEQKHTFTTIQDSHSKSAYLAGIIAKQWGASNDAVLKLFRNMEQLDKVVGESKDKTEKIDKTTKELGDKIEQGANETIDWSINFAQVASAVSSIAFGLNSVKNVMDTLTDDSSSFSDKISSVAINLPMIINSLSRTRGLFSTLKNGGFSNLVTSGKQGFINNLVALNGGNALTGLYQNNVANVQAEIEAAISSDKQRLSQLKIAKQKQFDIQQTANTLTSETTRPEDLAYLKNESEAALKEMEKINIESQAIQQNIDDTSVSMFNAAKESGKLAQGMSSTQKIVMKIAGKDGMGSWGSLIKGVGVDMASMVLNMGVMLAVSVGIAVAMKAISKFIQEAKARTLSGQLQTMSEELGKMSSSMSELKNMASEAEDAISSLNDAFDNFDNAKSNIDKLTKGTTEYKDAVRDANMALLDTLTSLNLLKDAKYRYEDGLLVVDNRKELQDTLTTQANNAKMSSLLAQGRTARQTELNNEANAVVNSQMIIKELGKTYDAATKYTNEQIANDIMEFTQTIAEQVENEFRREIGKTKGEDLTSDEQAALTRVIAYRANNKGSNGNSLHEETKEASTSVGKLVTQAERYTQALIDASPSLTESTITETSLREILNAAKNEDGTFDNAALESINNYINNYPNNIGQLLDAINGCRAAILGEGSGAYTAEIGRQALENSGYQLTEDQLPYAELIYQKVGEKILKDVDTYSATYKKDGLDEAAYQRFAAGKGYTVGKNDDGLYLYDSATSETKDIQDDTIIQELAMQDAIKAFQKDMIDAMQGIIDSISPEEKAQVDLDNADNKRKSDIASAENAYKDQLDFENNLTNYGAEELERYKDNLAELSPLLEKNADETDRVAKANMALNDGFGDLVDNYEDYIEALKNADYGTEEYSKALDALSKMVGIDVSELGRDFVEDAENLDLIRKAAEDDIDAIDELKKAAAEEIIIDSDIDLSRFGDSYNTIIDGIHNLEADDIEIGAHLDDQDFIDALNNMMAQGEMTSTEVQRLLSAMGYKWEIDDKTAYMTGRFADGTGTAAEFHFPELTASATTFQGSSKKAISSANKAKAKSNGSKGSGGGGGKSKETKDKKNFEDEVDRYHEIKEALDDVNRELQRNTKEKERAFGREKLRQLRKQNESLKEQVGLQEEYLRQIEEHYAQDAGALMAYGVTLDAATGRVQNYEAMLQSQIDTYNAAVEAYNNSAQSDADKKNLENAEKAYEKFKKSLEQYETTLNLYEEQMDKLKDLQNDLYDLQLESVKTKLEWRIGLNDDDIKLIEWQFKHIGDEAEKVADRISKLTQKAREYVDNIALTNNAIEEILGNHGYSVGSIDSIDYDNFNLTSDEVDTLRDYSDKLRDYYDTLVDVRQEIHDNVLKVFTDFNDDMDDAKSKVDNLTDSIDNLRSIAALMGKQTLGYDSEDLLAMSRQTLDNQREGLVIAKRQLDNDKQAVKELEADIQRLYAIGDTEGAKLVENNLKQAQEKLNEVQKDLESRIKDLAQKAQDVFTEAIDVAAEHYKKTLGGNSLDLGWLTEQYERQKKLDDLYLDEYEKLHGLNNLTREINKNMNNNPSPKIYGKLNDLLDDVNVAMAEGNQISQADLTTLENRLKVVQALAALEDAQNAKAEVRMTRDNEGNFSYTYTADEDAIDDAQSNYEDNFYMALKFQHERQDELQSQMLQNRQDFIDQMREIDNTYEQGSEEWYQARQDLMAYHQELEDYYLQQFGMNFDEMARLRDDDWADYEEKVGNKVAVNADFIDSFDQTIAGQLTGWQTAQEAHAAFTEASKQYLQESAAAAAQWKEDNDLTLQAAGSSIETFKEDANAHLQEIQQETQNTSQKTKEMADAFDANFQQAITAADKFEYQYGVAMESIRGQIDSTIGKINDMIAKLKEQGDAADSMAMRVKQAYAEAAAARAAFENGGGSSVGGNSGVDTSTTTDQSARQTYRVQANGYDAGRGKGVFTFYDNATGSPIYTVAAGNTDQARTEFMRAFGYSKMTGPNSSFIAYDTGGYTGAWGKDGRLAMLHEKELVLNKEDTSNILSVVDMVRGLADNLLSQGISFNNMMNHSVNYSALAGIGGSMEQDVHIEASFPGVVDRNEITEAMNQLINSASQYVNRRK